MRTHGWMITKDHLDGQDAEVCGPSNINSATMTRLINGGGEKFRMYDDDGILYYSGRMIHDDDTDGFEPLDDFGGPNSGCTRLDYLSNGQWETL